MQVNGKGPADGKTIATYPTEDSYLSLQLGFVITRIEHLDPLWGTRHDELISTQVAVSPCTPLRVSLTSRRCCVKFVFASPVVRTRTKHVAVVADAMDPNGRHGAWR